MGDTNTLEAFQNPAELNPTTTTDNPMLTVSRQGLHTRLTHHSEPANNNQGINSEAAKELAQSQKYIASCEKFFNTHNHLFSTQEQALYTTAISDCTTSHDQMRLLTQLTASLPERQRYRKIYSSIPNEYQSAWGDIKAMSLKECKKQYEKLCLKAEQEYEKAELQHPERRHIAKEDRLQAINYVKNPDTPLPEKIAALKLLDKQITTQKETISNPFENLLKQLDQFATPKEIKGFQDKFYDSPTFEKREIIFKQIEERLTQLQNEAQRLTKHYMQRLQADYRDKIISKQTSETAIKLWETKTLAEQKSTLAHYNQDRARRVTLLQQFLKLPPELQAQHATFLTLTHNQRKAYLAKITPAPIPTPAPETNKTEESIPVQNEAPEKSPQPKPDAEEDSPPQATEPSTPETTTISSDERERIKKITREVADLEDNKRARFRNELTRLAIREARQAEERFGTLRASKRTNDLTPKEKKRAQQVAQESHGSKIIQDGEVNDVIYISVKGLRDTRDGEAETKKEITRQGIGGNKRGKPNKSIEFYDPNNVPVSASATKRELEKRRVELEQNIIAAVTSRLLPKNNHSSGDEKDPKQAALKDVMGKEAKKHHHIQLAA